MKIENWFHHDDNAGTGYQLPPQQITPTHDNPIYAQYIELLQSGAIPAGCQESDQLPPQLLGPITPDNPTHAQCISLVQFGEYQIFDQRTGLLQQPLLENIYNPNAVLIPCTPQYPSDSTPPSDQSPVRCYSSPYDLPPLGTCINQAPPRHYTSPYDQLPQLTATATLPSNSTNEVHDPVASQTPEIRDREKVQRPRRRRYNRTFAAQMGWFDTPSASPESGSEYEPVSENERDV
jgi:hypothetical protein